MKFNCGPVREPEWRRVWNWQDHFCWIPTRIGAECYWLETVERKAVRRVGIRRFGYQFEYRVKQ